MSNKEQQAFDQFVKSHSVQLEAIGLPKSLWAELFMKLSQNLFDAGSAFVYGIVGDQKRTPYSVFSSLKLKKESQVFLVDHIWTSTADQVFTHLSSNEKLRDICYQLMNVEPLSDIVSYESKVDSESEMVEDGASMSLDRTFPSGYFLQLPDFNLNKFTTLRMTDDERQSIVAVNLRNNNITSLDEVVNMIGSNICQQVKALYLQNNPVVKSISMDDLIRVFPKLEIYNSKLTKNYTEWAIMFLEDIDSEEVVRSLDLSDRGLQIWKPEVFEKFSSCNVINARNTEFTVDCEDLFETIARMPKLGEILVDYVAHQLIHSRLESAGNRLDKLVKINGWRFRTGMPTIDELNATLINQKIWQYLNSYHFTFMNIPNWYLMDQLGISINHSEDPNVKVATIYYIDGQQAFNVLWPIKDIEAYEAVTRDFLFGVSPQEKREALMSIWDGVPRYFPNFDDKPEVKDEVHVNFDPSISQKEAKKRFTYYTDSQMVIDSLALQKKKDSTHFKLIESQEDADILFIVHEHVRNYQDIAQRKQFINQFEQEENYTMKGKLSQSTRPFNFPFIPETYDLSVNADQIEEFVLTWQKRKQNNEDNIWIVKPWNLSRSMDMTVSDDYTACLKASLTGPKICSKYISNPCLLKGKKFDFRFLVMMKPISGTEISVAVHNSYYIRIGNHKYSLDNFQDFQKHFTVMNYYEDPTTGEKHQVERISQAESLKWFEEEHGPWEPVKNKIFAALRDLFVAMKKYMLVNDASPYQRSVYGVDVILEDDLSPKILEVNYSPDAGRLVKYGEHPRFYIDVFKYLFANETPANITRLV